ncbi:MAG: hypothetical protein MR883_03345 [Clostridiales bacterium]|nr:hypothetical protein [Clostridiales bacterium]
MKKQECGVQGKEKPLLGPFSAFQNFRNFMSVQCCFNYDSIEKVSVIKVNPERNSDIKIAFGSRRVSISDHKPRSKGSGEQG